MPNLRGYAPTIWHAPRGAKAVSPLRSATALQMNCAARVCGARAGLAGLLTIFAISAYADVGMLLDGNLDTIDAGVGALLDSGTEQYSTSVPTITNSSYLSNRSIDLDGSTGILVGGNAGPHPVGGNTASGSSVADVATVNEFTVMCWINPDGLPRQAHFIVKRNRQITSFNMPRFFISQLGSQASVTLREGSASYAFVAAVPDDTQYTDDELFMITGGGTLVVGQWTHVAFTFSRSNDAAKLYIDGSPLVTVSPIIGGDATTSFAPDGMDAFDLAPNNANNLYVGYTPTGMSGGVEDFNGQLDEFQLVQMALSDGEVLAAAQNSLRPPQPISFTLIDIGDTRGVEFLSSSSVTYVLESAPNQVGPFTGTGSRLIGDGSTNVLFDPGGFDTGAVYRVRAQ